MLAYMTGFGWVSTTSMGRGKDYRCIISKSPFSKIKNTDIFETPNRHFGRLDNFSKMGIAAISFALKDAGLRQWSEQRNIGMIAHTRWGCLDTDIRYINTVLQNAASPNLFAYTLPNIFLGEASVSFGLTGVSFTISGDNENQSILLALTSLELCDSEIMLAGCCNVTPSAKHFSTPPSAYFIVLEKKTTKDNYGIISSIDQKILFNGFEIIHFYQLLDIIQNK